MTLPGNRNDMTFDALGPSLRHLVVGLSIYVQMSGVSAYLVLGWPLGGPRAGMESTAIGTTSTTTTHSPR
jgi:hypothetical protein